MSAVLRIESVTLRKPGVALPVAPLIRNQREGIWSDQVPAERAGRGANGILYHFTVFTLCSFLQRHQLLLPLCTHTTSWSSSLVSGEGLIRMYDSLFPWSVIPSDTGREEVSGAGNKIGTGYTAGCATSVLHTQNRGYVTVTHETGRQIQIKMDTGRIHREQQTVNKQWRNRKSGLSLHYKFHM